MDLRKERTTLDPDLWRSRRCLTQIEGFDHSVVNATLEACGDLPASQESPCFPFFVWQCEENKVLSEISTVMEFDFSKPISPCFGKVQTGMLEFCARVKSWKVDKRSWKQGIKFVGQAILIGIRGSSRGNISAEIEASFNPSNGEIDIKYAFT
ncbi:Protein arginine N-methyltransferase 1.6 [Camellia lanceoleosa]|uniref:Protein arginine N-methyltransferase 1.6 n=1 Tax=Camellia lanceoleosa TaxID=1840588 RepID=A0ACC0FFI7_9ERIC|nr:Protein arginine N-methyltransferase 1.6 [Camellia lanceoleosa]